jgi:hypothetical protein
MTPSGIEPATFRLVAQYLNHCVTAVPQMVGSMVEFWNKPSQIELHSVSALLRFSRTTVAEIRAYFRMLLPQLDEQNYRHR